MNIAIGIGAARSLANGDFNLIVGSADVPTPETSFFLSVDGKSYPTAAIYDADFRALVERRANEMAEENGWDRADPKSFDEFFCEYRLALN